MIGIMALDWEDVVLKSVFCIGFISLAKRVINLLTWLHSGVVQPPKDLRSYGSWAVVTGCTDGIGKAVALDLARKGLNLVLVGRSELKLEATALEMKQEQRAMQVRCVLVELAEESGEEVERRVREGIQGLDVGVLVNNAGAAYPYARFFHEVDLNLMDSVVGVNVRAATWVTRAVLPSMLRKGKGAIVNVGSGSAACFPSYPLYTVYSASKAYLGMLSRSMTMEYKANGIHIQCQIPLLVATKMSSIRKASWVVPSPEEYSRASLRWVGNGAHTCIPYWTHYAQWFLLIQPLPDFLLHTLAFTYFLSMRARGMRKDAALANASSSSSTPSSTT